MQDFEYKGLWWLPETPEHQVAGYLFFSQQSGFRLELIGNINPSGDPWDMPSYPIILGSTSNDSLTLYNCLQTHFRESSIQSSQFKVSTAYEGAHFKTSEELIFDSARIKLTYIEMWAKTTGRKFKHSKNPRNRFIKYTTPPAREFNTRVGRMSFIFAADHLFEESVFVKLSNFGLKNFDQLSREFVTPMQYFLTLGTTVANFIEELVFTHEDKRVKVYFQQPFYLQNKKYINTNQTLFSLPDISRNLSRRINKWLDLATEIDSVLHLFFRVRTVEGLFGELRFLTLAQAIET